MSERKSCPQLIEAQRLLGAGLVQDALVALDRALVTLPSSAWAWAHRGDLQYQHLGNYAEAIADFDRALELEPDYAWALAHRGASFERLDRFCEAERDLCAALALKPGYTWARAMLARVFQMTSRFEQGLEAIERVIDEDAWVLPYWREERAMMRMHLRRHDEAAHYFELALEADPNDRFAHYNAAVNRFYAHGLEAARPAFDRLRVRLTRAIESPRDSREVDRSIYELGGLMALEGKRDEALGQLRQAIGREHGLVLLSPARKRARVDMAWLGLRNDPEFSSLARPDFNQQQGAIA